jgi:hypothetical protein
VNDYAGKRYLAGEVPPTPPAVWWTVGGFLAILVLSTLYVYAGGLS